MAAIDRIRDQLARSVSGPAWHGPSLLETLDGVDLATASARPIESAHTIAELVPHVVTWMDAVRRRLGGDWSPVDEERDFPPPANTDSEWREAVKRIEAMASELDDAVTALADHALERRAPDGRFTIGQLLDGVVQHNLYHAGQIALLRKR